MQYMVVDQTEQNIYENYEGEISIAFSFPSYLWKSIKLNLNLDWFIQSWIFILLFSTF